MTPEELRSRALEVIVRDGYEAVTMAQIAAQVGVGVRTLHRHFPAKADLVWAPLDETFAQVRDALEATPASVSIAEAMGLAIEQSLGEQAQDRYAVRARLALIATTPELQEQQSRAFRRWCEELVAFAARRLGQRLDDLLPLVLGRAVQGAVMASLTWWALRDDDASLGEAVRRGVRELEEHIAGRRAETSPPRTER